MSISCVSLCLSRLFRLELGLQHSLTHSLTRSHFQSPADLDYHLSVSPEGIDQSILAFVALPFNSTGRIARPPRLRIHPAHPTRPSPSPTPHDINAPQPHNMASFMSNMLSGGGKDANNPNANANSSRLDLGRPSTPIRNSFIEPANTPKGSPSKRTAPPGARELPQAFESHLKLNAATTLDSPIKLGRPQSVITPLSPTKLSNAQSYDPFDAESTTNTLVDDSILQRGSPTTPLKHQGQENTPPTASKIPISHNHAAQTRQELYNSPRAPPPGKKFDTSRGLTDKERAILEKPNVRRLVNVTQLCEPPLFLLLDI